MMQISLNLSLLCQRQLKIICVSCLKCRRMEIWLLHMFFLRFSLVSHHMIMVLLVEVQEHITMQHILDLLSMQQELQQVSFLEANVAVEEDSMCTSPIFIDNPYLKGHRGYSLGKFKVPFFSEFDCLHDTISHKVRVPCGKCKQCLSMRQNWVLQRIQMESLRSELFYFTLTYANRGLKYTNHPDCSIPYPHYPDIQNLFKRLRKILPHPIRTYVVSEYGSKRKRPHFHGFIAVEKADIDTFYRGSHLYCEKTLFKEVFANWKRNTSSSHRYPVYMSLSDFVVRGKKRTYDLHWVEPIRNHDNDTTFYVTKYILKYDERTRKLIDKLKIKMKRHVQLNLQFEDSERISTDSVVKSYLYVLSQITPRSVMSKDFGDWKHPDIRKYIESCISKNKQIPQFYDINTGKSCLLASYYRKHLLGLDYEFERYWKYLHDVQYLDIPDLIDSYNPELLNPAIIKDYNDKSMSAIRQDKKLQKNLARLNKSY